MIAPTFLTLVPRRNRFPEATRAVKDLAAESGLGVASITGPESFEGLAPILERRIDRGRLDGLDWYTPERARFSVDPSNLMPTVRSVVALGVPFWTGVVEKPDDGVMRGRIARYAWGRDYHVTLRQRMQRLHAKLQSDLGTSIEARFLVDTARIVDRAVAARSGLGWYGKHSCVIVPGHGSWVMLGELLLDIDLDPDPPLGRDCGRCSMCIDDCPTGAIVGPYEVDTPRCLSFQTIEQRGAIPFEIRPLLGDWVFGCDVCQDVCPYTRAATVVEDPAFRPAGVENVFPSLERLLASNAEQFSETYGGTAVTRAKRRGLARNAAVALGNSHDPQGIPPLAQAMLEHDEPLVRGHAAWGLGAIGGRVSRSALDRARRTESAEDIRSEIEYALEMGNLGE